MKNGGLSGGGGGRQHHPFGGITAFGDEMDMTDNSALRASTLIRAMLLTETGTLAGDTVYWREMVCFILNM